jgi:hypothetical protein
MMSRVYSFVITSDRNGAWRSRDEDKDWIATSGLWPSSQ